MEFVYLLPVVGCAAMMGVMMWMMMRGKNSGGGAGQAGQPGANTAEEVATLRAEVATLRAQQDAADGRHRAAPTPVEASSGDRGGLPSQGAGSFGRGGGLPAWLACAGRGGYEEDRCGGH